MDYHLTKFLLLWLLGLLKHCISMPCSHGAVRLVNGQDIYEGRVEVCIHGAWKTVCDDYWDNNGAKVVCTQLGYQSNGAKAFVYARFGQGTGLIIEKVSCCGNETSLTSCQLHDEDDGYCHHFEDAGVQCPHCPTDGDIRLEGTAYPYTGWVEVCVDGVWSTVCYNRWDPVDASVVCRQLGYSRYGARALGLLGCGDVRKHLSFVRCLGNERRLIDCPHTITISSQCHGCYFWGDASVICQPSLRCQENELRLVNGSTDSEGRVEICLNETWGTVCINNWDEQDSEVVCKQLGYSDKGAKVNHRFESGTGGSIHLNNMQCTGNESNLYQCQYDISTVSCTRSAGVSCSFDTLHMPLNLQAVVDESNTCTLSWQPPITIKRHGTLINYLINCTIWRDENDYNITVYTNDTDQILILSPYVSYICCVSGVNEVGVGDPACQSFITYESAPTAPPTNTEVHPFNATSIFLSWRPPLVKHRNGIIREYDIEVIELNTTTKFMYTTQDPYLLINNLDPDKVYMCRIAAITIGKGPYSELITINLFTKNDYCHSEQSSVDTCKFTEVVLAMSITSGVLLLILFFASIVLVVVCLRSRLCKHSQENTSFAVQSPVYEMVDITGSDFGNNKTATVTREQYSQPPTTPPAQLSNDHTSNTNFGIKEENFTPVSMSVTQPTNGESTYQPLIPLRAHQKSISTEYQSLRQLSKEKPRDLPPPIPPKRKC